MLSKPQHGSSVFARSGRSRLSGVHSTDFASKAFRTDQMSRITSARTWTIGPDVGLLTGPQLGTAEIDSELVGKVNVTVQRYHIPHNHAGDRLLPASEDSSAGMPSHCYQMAKRAHTRVSAPFSCCSSALTVQQIYAHVTGPVNNSWRTVPPLLLVVLSSSRCGAQGAGQRGSNGWSPAARTTEHTIRSTPNNHQTWTLPG